MIRVDWFGTLTERNDLAGNFPRWPAIETCHRDVLAVTDIQDSLSTCPGCQLSGPSVLMCRRARSHSPLFFCSLNLKSLQKDDAVFMTMLCKLCVSDKNFGTKSETKQMLHPNGGFGLCKWIILWVVFGIYCSHIFLCCCFFFFTIPQIHMASWVPSPQLH